MNDKTTSQAGERTQNEGTFPIDIIVTQIGNWHVGFGWVTLTIGGSKATGLALYARYRMNEPKRHVVANFKAATDWLLDVAKVPQRASGKLMAKAMSEGDFGDMCKNDPRLCPKVIPSPSRISTKATKATHTPGPWFLPDGDANAVLCGEPNDPQIVAMLEGDDIMFVADFSQTQGNARLIAAAPDLLEALELMAEMTPSGQGDKVDCRRFNEIARLYIAKAKGAK